MVKVWCYVLITSQLLVHVCLSSRDLRTNATFKNLQGIFFIFSYFVLQYIPIPKNEKKNGGH